MYRRIEEVIGEIQDTRQPSHYTGELDPLDVAEGPVHGPPSKKQELDDALMNLRKFRRVQLIDKSPQGGIGRVLSRRSSMSSTTTTDDEDLGKAPMVPQGRFAVPTLIEWEGAGERVYVTGTFAAWRRKFRLDRK